MTTRRTIIYLLTCVLFGVAGIAAPADADDTWDSPEIERRLQTALDDWRSGDDVHGSALRVYAPGRLDWTGTSGSSRVFPYFPKTTRFSADEHIRVGSATKTFTAVTVLQLIEEGRLAFDATLDRFLPDYPNAEKITVRQLLEHRSGIPEIQLADFLFLLTVIGNPYESIDPVEFMYEWTFGPVPIISLFAGLEPVPRGSLAEPGTEFNYSQPGFFALGIIVEALTGKSLAENFAERIYEPLGMKRTALLGKNDPIRPVGYTAVFGLLPLNLPERWLVPSTNRFNTSAWAAGGLASTAGDLVTFLHAVMTRRIVSPENFVEMTTMKPIEAIVGRPSDAQYGLGLFLNLHDGYTTYGHGGSVPSGNSVMNYVPELDVYIGAVSNTDRSFFAENPNITQRVVEILGDAAPD